MVLLLMGMKHTGKSSIAPLLAEHFGGEWLDLDDEIELIYRERPETKDHGASISFRHIYKKEGEKRFRELEAQALKKALQKVAKKSGRAENTTEYFMVIATGGGLGDNLEALKAAEKADYRIYIDTPTEILYQRVLRGGLPAYLPEDKPFETFQDIHRRRHKAYCAVANLTVQGNEKTPAEITDEIVQKTTIVFGMPLRGNRNSEK